MGLLQTQPASAVGSLGDFPNINAAGCGVRPCCGRCARTAVLSLPNLSLPGLLPVQGVSELGRRGSGERRRKHSHREAFLSSVLLILNQFLKFPSVISSHFCSSCLSFQLFCHEQRCQHPLDRYRKVRVHSPSSKKGQSLGVAFFFLSLWKTSACQR